MYSDMSSKLNYWWSLEFETRTYVRSFTNVTIFHMLCVHFRVVISCQLHGSEALWDLQRTYQVVSLLFRTLCPLLYLIDHSLTIRYTSFFVSKIIPNLNSFIHSFHILYFSETPFLKGSKFSETSTPSRSFKWTSI